MPTPEITITAPASAKIGQILSHTPSKPHFRVQIKGGGCSGFEYVFGIDDNIREQDFSQEVTTETGRFSVLIDAISHQYIHSATIDFKRDEQGERFVVSNPNARAMCSCGSSFAVADHQDNGASQ
ncbi:HesB/IscA family protein [Candidatus Synchoanobacter obligatus]|uniref:Iron-sulfur cluster assembly accessory protein n=1 Tax=Candidatus Synchoanobacter obligatus TaxID=2919597 RepID=A0ABT1L4S0_9GAMM|nr:iron-sulfur cluster assembly accessory protein [Candidatus Synchoanobacter obligatus]MCP8352177.1 iron-sulfur cluster assembly accessory protein [Candidatus Synchoanobacter obligatus]